VADFPNIFFMCMHKGGSTFVAGQLFRSLEKLHDNLTCYPLARLYVDWFHEVKQEKGWGSTISEEITNQRMLEMLTEFPIPQTGALVSRFYPTHWKVLEQYYGGDFPPDNARLLLMRRDPRDALVSMYYSVAYSHSPKAMSAQGIDLEAERKQLQEQGVYDWIASVLAQPESSQVLGEFIQCAHLLDSHPDAVDLPYELLINDSDTWLRSFIAATGLDDVVDQRWYRRMKNHLKPPEQVDHMKHKRRMRPGNWRDVFDDKLTSMMKDRVGQVMEKLDYSW